MLEFVLKSKELKISRFVPLMLILSHSADSLLTTIGFADKFGQKFGTLLRADERVLISERVKQTFQQIQQIRSNEQLSVDLGFFM